MREFLTPNDRANEIKMLRSSFKGTFLLIEGSTDKIFYGRLTNKSICTLFPISGKPSSKSLVINVLQILEQSEFAGVLAIVDADFDHLETLPASSSNLLYTDSHDLETMILSSNALEKVVGEYSSEDKMIDILPGLKARGFWDQTAKAGKARLTSPNPMVDAPT
jgi:Protein of unknown function (DUF4435)